MQKDTKSGSVLEQVREVSKQDDSLSGWNKPTKPTREGVASRFDKEQRGNTGNEPPTGVILAVLTIESSNQQIGKESAKSARVK